MQHTAVVSTDASGGMSPASMAFEYQRLVSELQLYGDLPSEDAAEANSRAVVAVHKQLAALRVSAVVTQPSAPKRLRPTIAPQQVRPRAVSNPAAIAMPVPPAPMPTASMPTAPMPTAPMPTSPMPAAPTPAVPMPSVPTTTASEKGPALTAAEPVRPTLAVPSMPASVATSAPTVEPCVNVDQMVSNISQLAQAVQQISEFIPRAARVAQPILSTFLPPAITPDRMRKGLHYIQGKHGDQQRQANCLCPVQVAEAPGTPVLAEGSKMMLVHSSSSQPALGMSSFAPMGISPDRLRAPSPADASSVARPVVPRPPGLRPPVAHPPVPRLPPMAQTVPSVPLMITRAQPQISPVCVQRVPSRMSAVAMPLRHMPMTATPDAILDAQSKAVPSATASATQAPRRDEVSWLQQLEQLEGISKPFHDQQLCLVEVERLAGLAKRMRHEMAVQRAPPASAVGAGTVHHW